jgi:hypothetical protein
MLCLTVKGWVRYERIQAASGLEIDGGRSYRFEKAALVQWWHEQLTFGETMVILGV